MRNLRFYKENKIAGRNINNRYADGTSVMAESEEEQKSFH